MLIYEDVFFVHIILLQCFNIHLEKIERGKKVAKQHT